MKYHIVLTLIIIIGFAFATVHGELGPRIGKKGVWYKAHLTWYKSYPEEGSEECVKYNGCEYAGLFSFVSGKQSEEWVRNNNIIAVHERHAYWLELKQLRLRTDPNDSTTEIVGTVYDMCADTDCGGCCTRNAGEYGYLIDLEVSTLKRLGYTTSSYPDAIYFMVYETKEETLKREIKEIKKKLRKVKRDIRRSSRMLKK